MTPQTLVALANLGRPRRPAGASEARGQPVLPDPAAAARQLASLTGEPVTGDDLPALRLLQQESARAASALLAGLPVEAAAINALARGSTGRVELAVGSGGQLRQDLAWHDPSLSACLARRLIGELAAVDPQRLRRCARPECDLLFYDTTRSRTQRWHAEDPCGWRERQRRRRDELED